MRAATYTAGGPPGVFRYADLPDPVPTSGEVRIRVQHIGVEGADLARRRGAEASDEPVVVGYSAAGVVESIGADVTRFRPGDRVATFNWDGAYAELRTAPEDFVFAVPDEVDLAVAATVPVAFGTADVALSTLRQDQAVFVRGATGGVGIAVVQIARAAGAVVIATASDSSRAEKLISLGAARVIDGRDADLAGRLREATDGQGVDLIVDLVGGEATASLIGALRVRGHLAVTGLGAGTSSSLPLDTLLRDRLTITGVMLGAEMHLPDTHERVRRIFSIMAGGDLSMPIAARFPLARAAEAHDFAENNRPFGRVIIEP